MASYEEQKYLGSPSNWLSILEREGALAVIGQRLTYWQNLPLLTDNIIRAKSFQNASDLLCEAIKRKRIPWVEFCAHLNNWRMAEAILRQVNPQPATTSQRESFEPPINSWEPAKLQAFKALLTQLERIGIADRLESMAAISNYRLKFDRTSGHMRVNFTLWFFESYKLEGPMFANAIWCILQQNVPMSNTMIDAIRNSRFYAMFDCGSAPVASPSAVSSGLLDPMMIDIAPAPQAIPESPRQLTGKAYLRHLLSSAFVDHDDTDEDKDAHIETVLKDININKFLRQVPWLLPDGSTLWDMLNNLQGNWAPIIAALVEVAERGIGEVDTTFPVLNSRKALEEALKQSIDSLPFIEVIIYDPKMSRGDRQQAWIDAAPTVLSQRDFCTWLNKASLANKQLSQAQMNSMLNKLMIKVEKDIPLRRQVLAAVRQKAPNWTMADFDSLIPSLFDKAAAGKEPELSFSASNGWAKTFLQKLEIVNPALEKHLEEMEDDLSMFGLTAKKDWPAQLLSWGATGAQHFKITAALVKDGLIS